jgi:hypothetical protein
VDLGLLELRGISEPIHAFGVGAEGVICRDAIARAYDCRIWQVLWLVIETTAGSLAATGRLAQAAVVYGHLAAHHPPSAIAGVGRARQRRPDRVRQLPEFESLMAQGADMDRHELVAYTRECLGRATAPLVGSA